MTIDCLQMILTDGLDFSENISIDLKILIQELAQENLEKCSIERPQSNLIDQSQVLSTVQSRRCCSEMCEGVL